MGPVLIIEDDPDIVESLRYGLESAEFETRVAFTGEEGLAASLSREPAPVAMDQLSKWPIGGQKITARGMYAKVRNWKEQENP